MRRALTALALTAFAAAAPLAHAAAPSPADDLARLKARAAAVTITRDDWGIAHVRGHADADAVFGMVYAQAEDDFNRVETNFLTNLGRSAEAEGETAIWKDLRQRLIVDETFLKAQYAASPDWLKTLMGAWADGLNYYLATHPNVRPRVITHFEPWMALSFSEGSIGGDIERVNLDDLQAFYGAPPPKRVAMASGPHEPSGSNGMAIGPHNTVAGYPLLLINPHTSFFFRSELQATSDEGLNVYGAATWGQFFIYQGFNAHVGWMHTSSGIDNVDRWAETVRRRGGRWEAKFGQTWEPLTVSTAVIAYRTANGGQASRSLTIWKSRHGPVIAAKDGKWISIGLMNTPAIALQQSFLRTKAHDYASYVKVAELKANSSNNTLLADDSGEIAYLHPQFVPRRDDRFDFRQIQDGADPATAWGPLHALTELPSVKDPASGFVFNTNNWPYSAAGPDSARRAAFPKYMDRFGENERGVHALRLLSGKTDFTPRGLINTAYDSWMPAFGSLIPPLAKAWDDLPAADPRKTALAGPIAALRAWDGHWGINSVETSLGVFYGESLWAKAKQDPDDEGLTVIDELARNTSPEMKLAALSEAVERLTADFGTWKTPWGQINRFQRFNDDIAPRFDDAKPSIPVAFASAQWGSLASFGAKPYPNTKKWYGSFGNSFVAVVQFGPKVKAWAVTAGGESGDPASKHFNDQNWRYAQGDLRPVYFWPEDLAGHVERVYHPGE